MTLFHLDEFTLYHVSFLPIKFHIKHAAHIGRLVRIGPSSVGREPDCVAKLVRSIVHVNEDLLLRNGLTKGGLPL